MDTQFFVNIIESPRDDEVYNNTSEIILLKKMLQLHDIKCVSRVAINKNYFFKGIVEGFIEGIEIHKLIPILHISCHGSANGIKLSCGDVIEWDELKHNLCNINNILSGKLLLCMSSCKGFSACKMAMDNENSLDPFWALVGNNNHPTWTETAIAYATFYHLIIRGHSLESAVKTMRQASDNKNWDTIPYSHAQQSYVESIKQIRTEGLLTQLLQYNKI